MDSMSLSAQSMASAIEANMQSSLNAANEKISEFALAVGTGVVNHLKNAQFKTLDIGINLPVGMSSETGLLGISSGIIFDTAQGIIQANGPKGKDWLMAIVEGVAMSLSSDPTLKGIHSVVGQGVGIVIPGSFSITKKGLIASIRSEFDKIDAKGPKIPDIARGLGEGIVKNFSSATQIMQIKGGPPDIPIPIPKAGPGNGILM